MRKCVLDAPFASRWNSTSVIGSIADRDCVRRAIEGADAVLHAATLHKPHVATHPPQAFVDTNVTGTVYLIHKIALSRFCRTYATLIRSGVPILEDQRDRNEYQIGLKPAYELAPLRQNAFENHPWREWAQAAHSDASDT